MKKRLKCGALALTLVLALGLLAGCGPATTGGGDEDPGSAPEETPQSETELLSGKHHVQIAVQDYGTITLELDADAAPVTVTNFVNLAQAGFYDGLTFHRIVPGFVIQGGDPAGNGTGGSDETIVGEFSANGHENPISHVRGTISMARSQDYDSASSQFFIVLEDATYLDGQYAAFGTVTEGMEIADQICEHTPVADMNSGSVDPADQPGITSVTVSD